MNTHRPAEDLAAPRASLERYNRLRAPQPQQRQLSAPMRMIAARRRAAAARPAPEVVVADVCEKFGLQPWQLFSVSREVVLQPARRELCFRLVVECRLSYVAAGRVLGGRHHTSILKATERHLELNPDAGEAYALMLMDRPENSYPRRLVSCQLSGRAPS